MNNDGNTKLAQQRREEVLRKIEEGKYNQQEDRKNIDQKKHLTASKRIIEIIEDNENNVTLFHDETGEPFAKVKIHDHFEVWRTKSKHFKRYISMLLWQENIVAGSEAFKAALDIINAKAIFDGKVIKLHNRVAHTKDDILYDLSDNRWRAVKISKYGWKILGKPPILFVRHHHQQPQIDPVKGGDPRKIFNFINIKDDDNKILLLIYIIACFIPDVPHPILNIYGPQGSAKSMLSKIIKKIVDPSAIEVTGFNRSEQELIQTMSHHWLIAFDNISRMPDWVSDLLCKTVTGTGFSKRELYSDDEDIIYSLRRCFVINGINLEATKPDLLDRSILLPLERINTRRKEEDVLQELDKHLPEILGGIFDTLSMAIQYRRRVDAPDLPRMADFAAWGCAIALALGHSQEDFMCAYLSNIAIQHSEVVSDSPVAQSILLLMKDKETWEGTSSELKAKLDEIAEINQIDLKSLPKAANALSRKVNELKTNLEESGLTITNRTENKKRIITIRKDSENIDSIDSSRDEAERKEKQNR